MQYGINEKKNKIIKWHSQRKQLDQTKIWVTEPVRQIEFYLLMIMDLEITNGLYEQSHFKLAYRLCLVRTGRRFFLQTTIINLLCFSMLSVTRPESLNYFKSSLSLFLKTKEGSTWLLCI